MALLAGVRVGDYIVQELIWRGGMGEVYRARDARADRFVALKLVSPELAGKPDRFARFDREMRTGAVLNHPNIEAVYDFGSYDGRPFVVSEWLQGTSLRERMPEGPLGREVAVGYSLQIASGLIAAHQLDVVHRALTPENIFVTHGGRVKIVDFGLGGWPDPVGSLAGAYRSPEQVRGAAVDHRSDIFSLGVILYEMVEGVLPFQGSGECPAFARAGDLEPVIRQCLATDPGDRFQSARDLAFGLELVDLVPRREMVDPVSVNRWLPHHPMWLT